MLSSDIVAVCRLYSNGALLKLSNGVGAHTLQPKTTVGLAWGTRTSLCYWEMFLQVVVLGLLLAFVACGPFRVEDRCGRAVPTAPCDTRTKSKSVPRSRMVRQSRSLM